MSGNLAVAALNRNGDERASPRRPRSWSSGGGTLLVFGITALARGGFSGSLNEPSFTIVGIRHTTADRSG